MTDVGYVIAGWSVAGVVLGGYTVRLTRRIRRAEHERTATGAATKTAASAASGSVSGSSASEPSG
jgi:hypothetical protein